MLGPEPGPSCRAVLWRVRFVYPFDVAVGPGVYGDRVTLGAGGLLPAALLSAGGAEACTLDPAAFTLGNGDGHDTPVARGQDKQPLASCEDADGDGDLDLVLQFEQKALELNRDLLAGANLLVLYGDLGDGDAVEGKAKVEAK